MSLQCSSNDGTATALSGDESDKASESVTDASASTVESQLRKRYFVLKELFDTEQAYVKDLELIVDGYIRAMRDQSSEIAMPEDLKNGKDRMVFGNIEAIYEFHHK